MKVVCGLPVLNHHVFGSPNPLEDVKCLLRFGDVWVEGPEVMWYDEGNGYRFQQWTARRACNLTRSVLYSEVVGILRVQSHNEPMLGHDSLNLI
jgi:hypothetical protein